ncbi:ATP-binding protein [Spirosoma sp. SC4-14]|uniref:sensor histidine kinase n=1 Tax=Spirosoma sp. SC4-14 TaxID=3128900 RepID=UPI0030CBF7BC
MHYFKEKAALKAQYEQEILTSQIEVQNATLQHISQELHDNIGQLLSVARINLNIVEEAGTDNENREFIQQANELVAQSISDLRALTKSLDGDFVQDFGLKESIAQELQRIRQTRRFGTELQISGTVYSLGFQREIVLFRIAQEILNNAIKHSEASQLTVQLQFSPEQLTLSILDNGKGFDYQTISQNSMSQSGAGLRNIKRRITLIGGTCEIFSSPGNGTQLTFLIPNQ